MRILTFAQGLFAVGVSGLGILSLCSGDFAMNWQPVPDWVPARTVLALLSGALLLGGGAGLLFRRTEARAATVMAWCFLAWLVLLQLPRVAKAPLDPGVWLGFSETVLLVVGAWVLAIACRNRKAGEAEADRYAWPLRLYAAALPLIGLSHFVYSEATASMVPAWLPHREDIALLTGGAHMAAGIGLLIGAWPRLAARLEATMISLFVLLLHIPLVVSQPSSRFDWTMLFIAMAYAASAWTIAGTVPAPGKELNLEAEKEPVASV